MPLDKETNLVEELNSCEGEPSDAALLDSGGGRVRESQSLTEYTKFLIEEIANAYKTSKLNSIKARQNIQFYHIVRGGNVRVVQSVLEQLENNDMTDELTWLIGNRNENKRNEAGAIFKVLHVLTFVLLAALFIVLTPVFYCFHALAHDVYAHARKRLMSNVDLPFVFAVLSERKEMIELFIKYGSNITCEDSDGNNVYHYLADLSGDEPYKAIHCHHILVSCCDSVNNVRDKLMLSRNYLQLTAFEAIGKYGSLHYLHHLIESRGSIGSRQLVISENSIWAKTSDVVFNLPPHESGQSISTDCSSGPLSSSVAVSIWEFDIKRFEKGDIFGKQSYLLQLITGRSVDELPLEDVTAVFKSRVVAKWMQAKIQMYIVICALSHAASMAISMLLLAFLLIHGGDMIEYPMSAKFFESFVKYASENTDLSDSYQSAVADLYKSCAGQSEEDVRRMAFGDSEPVHHTRTDNLMTVVLALLICFQTFTDVLVRITFLWKNFNFRAKSFTEALLPVIYRWIPGSYAEKQLSVILFIPYVLTIHFRDVRGTAISTASEIIEKLFMLNMNETTRNYSSDVALELKEEMQFIHHTEQIISIIFMACLLLRFFHTIHALRLLPGIGFFIITTKKMGRHLFQFGLVFGIVMLAFATMFHLCIREPQCPGLKAEGFTTLGESIFSTYQVSLGQGDTDHFGHNWNSEIAYVACTVVIIIMLLNLIIAVMTTTATDMNATPRKQVLCLVEMWDEILGTEAQVLSWTQLIRYIRQKCCYNRKAKWGRCSGEKTHDNCIVVYYGKDSNEGRLN